MMVDSNVSALGQCNARRFQGESPRVRRSSGGDQQVASLNPLISVMVFSTDADMLAGESLDFAHLGLEQHFDSLTREVLQKCLRDIEIFLAGNLLAVLDNGHRGPEAAQGLREFPANLPS